jgi:hypothetical protein
MGKMSITVSRSNPEKVYALIESDSNKDDRGLYLSTNAGKAGAKSQAIRAWCSAR